MDSSGYLNTINVGIPTGINPISLNQHFSKVITGLEE
jgi:hypothetical protein